MINLWPRRQPGNAVAKGGWRGLIPLLAVVMVAAGCGSSTTTSSSSSAACPHTAGTLVMGAEEEPSTLLLESATASTTSGRTEGLIESHLVNVGPNWQIVPELAQSWNESSDGLTYTFHLNPKAKWSDGVPVTASDVAFTFSQLSQSNLNGLMDRITSATATNAATFVVTLKSPFAGFLVSLGNENDYFDVLPQHVLQNQMVQGLIPPTSSFNTAPVSSGAFKFKEWVKGDHVTFVRDPNYYLAGLPCLGSVIVKFTPDPATREVAFQTGEINLLWSYDIPFQDLNTFKSNPSKYQIVPGGLGVATSDFLLFNTMNKYLGNKLVRQAIAYAIDRNDYLQKADFGVGKVAHSIINSTLSQFSTDKYDVYNFDPTKANALLDQAGFPKGSNGTRFTVSLRVRPDRAFEARGADIIKSRLADVGIKVNLLPMDAASLYTTVYTKYDFDMAIQLRTTGPDPASNQPLMVGKVGFGSIAGNGGRYSNPQLETLFSQDAQAVTVAQRQPIWDQVQKITMDDVPWLPLFEFPNEQLASANFGNVVVGELDYQGRFNQTYQKS